MTFNIIKNLTKINFTNANNVKRIKYIVIHYFGNVGTAKAVANYFATAYRGSSAHLCIDEKDVYQSVEFGDISWHCGTSGIYYHADCRNSNSIGIEVRPYKVNKATLNASDDDWYFTPEIIDKLVEVVKYLMNEYNVPIENVIRHYDVTHKLCPRPFVGDDINSYYNDTGNNMWKKFLYKLEENDMDEKLLNDWYDKVNPLIKDINDVRLSNAFRKEIRTLLDEEIINGGTVKTVNPDDINMRLETLKAIIVSKR